MLNLPHFIPCSAGKRQINASLCSDGVLRSISKMARGPESLPSYRSANRQSSDEKRQNYAEHLKLGTRPKISGNNHVKTVKKQDREKPGWDNKG